MNAYSREDNAALPPVRTIKLPEFMQDEVLDGTDETPAEVSFGPAFTAADTAEKAVRVLNTIEPDDAPVGKDRIEKIRANFPESTLRVTLNDTEVTISQNTGVASLPIQVDFAPATGSQNQSYQRYYLDDAGKFYGEVSPETFGVDRDELFTLDGFRSLVDSGLFLDFDSVVTQELAPKIHSQVVNAGFSSQLKIAGTPSKPLILKAVSPEIILKQRNILNEVIDDFGSEPLKLSVKELPNDLRLAITDAVDQVLKKAA